MEQAIGHLVSGSALSKAFLRNKARGVTVVEVKGRLFRKVEDGDDGVEVGQLPPKRRSAPIAVEEVNALGEHKSGPYVSFTAAARATIGQDPKNAISEAALSKAFARHKAIGAKVVPCKTRYYRKVVRK